MLTILIRFLQSYSSNIGQIKLLKKITENTLCPFLSVHIDDFDSVPAILGFIRKPNAVGLLWKGSIIVGR